MLILSRKIGESLMIGDSIKLKIVEIRGNQVRIGIDAPREVMVHRQEIYERIQDDKAVPMEQPCTKQRCFSRGNMLC